MVSEQEPPFLTFISFKLKMSRGEVVSAAFSAGLCKKKKKKPIVEPWASLHGDGESFLFKDSQIMQR